MQNINSSTNSPRSVTEHPSFVNNRSSSMMNAGLSLLPGLLPRNAIVLRLPASMAQGQNASADNSRNAGNSESTSRTYIATSRNANTSAPLPYFPNF